MSYVLKNEQGLYYGGYADSAPILYRTKREETKFDDEVADKVLKQLTDLGFTGWKKERINE